MFLNENKSERKKNEEKTISYYGEITSTISTTEFRVRALGLACLVWYLAIARTHTHAAFLSQSSFAISFAFYLDEPCKCIFHWICIYLHRSNTSSLVGWTAEIIFHHYIDHWTVLFLQFCIVQFIQFNYIFDDVLHRHILALSPRFTLPQSRLSLSLCPAEHTQETTTKLVSISVLFAVLRCCCTTY